MNKLTIGFDNSSYSEIEQYLKQSDFSKNIEVDDLNEIFILTVKENYDEKSIMEVLKKQKGVKSVNYVYVLSDFISPEKYITDEIVLQFKKGVSEQLIDEMNRKYNISLKRKAENYQIVSVPVYLDILDVANEYHLNGLTNFCYPNFISKIDYAQSLPNDPYFINQYYLYNTGQIVNGRSSTVGNDINVVNAWNMTKGDNDIIVAVLDEGVTSNHPDLLNSSQMRLSGANFGNGNINDVSPTGDGNHGNSCAGIISAAHNYEGISGIAPNCKIMPIRIFNADGIGVSEANVASAITFAKNNGADILSNSWCYDTNDPYFSSVIVNAIDDAAKNGRDGRGCVIVFAAGNTANHTIGNSGFICFPANTKSIPGFLSVGSIDRNGLQANYSPTSVWGSLNNQIIDIVAPSHKAYSFQIPSETYDVWSIDVPGSYGYNNVKHTDGGSLPLIGSYLPSSGVNYNAYTGYFGGTSASCPQVAGVAALILSKNPELMQEEVSHIIESTAKKIAGYTYNFSRSSGTWSNQVGSGLIDAYMAVSSTPRTVFFKVLNSYQRMSAFNIEIFTENWGESLYNESFVLNQSEEYSVRYNFQPGNYCVTAYAEMDNVLCDFCFNVSNGGYINFDFLVNNSNNMPYWGTPQYILND